MGKLLRVLAVTAAVLLGVTAGAAVLIGPAGADDVLAVASENVVDLGTLPDTEGAVSVNFLTYGRGPWAKKVMFLSGTFGLKSYDVSDPAAPRLLDELPASVFELDTDAPNDPSAGYGRAFWQNEDMDVDPRRKLVFMARDPRAFDGTTSDPADRAGVYIVDARKPAELTLRLFHELPTGHTTTCINQCNFLWTGGPASNVDQAADWPGGRPIFVTDLRDLDNVTSSVIPIDTERYDGVTAYAHDVQVDSQGIAWVSGSGGVRGYWTKGRHWDPVQRRLRGASPTRPIPYAGGGTSEEATPSMFMHNSDRPYGDDDIPGVAEYGYTPGSLILATEEAFGSATCDGRGVFVIASLKGSYAGQGWKSTPEEPFRLTTVGTWSPTGEAGTDPAAPFCSAHYFDRDRDIIAYSWYAQGTRFLDISDPGNPFQIAYYRPDAGVSFAPYFYDDYVYVADIALGLQILQLDDGALTAKQTRRPVEAPALNTTAWEITGTNNKFDADSLTSFICIIPTATQ